MSETTLQTITLSVPDISCAHCARTIEGAVSPLPGVREVSVDIPGKRVQVRYDETQDLTSRIGDVLAEEGYPVASIDAAGSASAR